MAVLAHPTSRWLVPTRDRTAENRLAKALGISGLLAAVLVRRGWTDPEAAHKFLNPTLEDLHDPTLLPDYDKALAAILGARERGEKIYVHGDYDVDGVTSAAMFARFLRKVGCEVLVHVPHRMKEGYGIHLSAVDEAAAQGAKLFLTCDCGGSAIEQVQRARNHGMNVVVTDHHILGDTLPDADAVVNPHRDDSKYPFKDLSGAGVAFKLCEGIARELKHNTNNFRRAYLDLAALGTIADVMPLLGENRIIARFGLSQLTETKKIGLQALKRAAKVSGVVTSYQVGYVLGPRINAAGRVDDADLALQLLMTSDEIEAASIASQIESINEARRAEQQRIIQEAIEIVQADGAHQKNVIIVAKEGWHAGVIGIVAGRLAEQFRRPTFVFTIDPETRQHKGSGRSIPKFHLANAIHDHMGLFLGGGGHAMAAGCSFDEVNKQAILDAMEVYASERLTPEDFEVSIQAEAEVEPGEINGTALQDIAQMEPFGHENPEPWFVARGMSFLEIKATRNESVAQCVLRKGEGAAISGVIFGAGAQLLQEPVGTVADVLFSPGEDEFRGRKTIKWKLKEYEVQSSA